MTDPDAQTKLREENTRLAALLDAHGIDWRLPAESSADDASEGEASRLSTDEKVALFAGYSVAALTCIRFAGRAKQLENPDMRRPAQTNGLQVFAKSRASNVQTATSAY